MATVLDEVRAAETSPQPPITNSRLAVIVPVFNEEHTVAELLRRLEAQPCVSQLIIVDDGSTDRTWQELLPWRARASFQAAQTNANGISVIVLQHESNCGKGRAIRTGLQHVTRSHVMIQDADLEYDPADISGLWDVLLTSGASVVYGSRYMNAPQLQYGRFVLQSGVRILNLLVHLLYGVRLTDEATCYKLFRTDDLRGMNLQCEHFEFCPEVTAKMVRMGLSMIEHPISYTSRSVKEGKKLRLRDGLMAIRVLLKYRKWSGG